MNDDEKAARIRPMGDRVIVKRERPQEKTAGGLHIPQMAQEKTMRGTVIQTGPGRTGENGQRIEMSVKKGDVVLFGRYAGIEQQGDYIILREDDLLGVDEP